MRISYLLKLLFLLLGLVVVLEISSYSATRIVIREAVTDNARRELSRGGEVFAQLMQARAEQLALSVNVLSNDFGFRDAVASGDADTISSALVNHAARIEADIGIVFNRQGELVASSVPLNNASDQRLTDLQSETARSGAAYASLIINNKPYQFVLSSVRAPLMIGFAGMGFEIEENLTRALKRLTGLEVSFVRIVEGQVNYLSGSLDDSARVALIDNLHNAPWQENTVWESDGMMNLVVAVAKPEDGLVAVLQVPLTQVLAPFSALDSQLLWLAFLFSLVATGVAYLMARSVTQPVRALAETAKQIGAGNYATPVLIKSNDEFGDLANAFVKMQVAIGDREQEIIYQSEHDPLTKLANRSRVFPRLAEHIDAAAKRNERFSLLLIDIRNFTQINDELTPEIGDQVLHQVAQRLAQITHSFEQVLRLGSDEFLVLSTDGDTARTLELAEAIHQLFSAPIVLGELYIKIDFNIGIASYPDDGDVPETLLRRVNLALNQGRQTKQQTCVYQQGWDEVHLRRLLLLRQFKQALDTPQISLSYQPKISLREPQRVSAEALVRWHHPQMGFINPEEFISVIESAGQVSLLTRWVVKTAVIQLRRLTDAGIPLPISVNLSALDLLVDDFPDYLQAVLHEYAIAPSYLCLEITESAIMREAEKSLYNLNRMKEMGMSLSIDDFGTGYSSLSQLKKLPVSELKIDKSFILKLDSSDDDQLIVRSTIELGHTLGLSVTAEGVETEAAKQLLKSYGCDTAQGYLYSRPLPEKDFALWVKNYLMSLAND